MAVRSTVGGSAISVSVFLPDRSSVFAAACFFSVSSVESGRFRPWHPTNADNAKHPITAVLHTIQRLCEKLIAHPPQFHTTVSVHPKPVSGLTRTSS